jgi:hypothetical protein
MKQRKSRALAAEIERRERLGDWQGRSSGRAQAVIARQRWL